MMNTDIEQMLVSTLPDHLIFDNILPRLPAKTLLRFKSVCKLWLSIISSFEFARSHLKFSSLFPQFVFLTRDKDERKRSKLFLIHYDDNNNVTNTVRVDMDPDWKFPLPYYVGSCNGLLCFYLQGDPNYFCVWNPVTQQYRNIMTPRADDLVLSYGFTYASSIDDYKIAAETDNGEVFYLSLRSDKWKRIDGRNQTEGINNTRFYPLRNFRRWKEDKCIIGFDLVDETFKEIPYMNWLSRYRWVSFIAIKEYVSLYCVNFLVSEVWVLKQYGDWNSWEKVFSAKATGDYYFIITETGHGKCLSQSLNDLKLIDLSEGAPDESRVGVVISDELCESAVYVESLISPFVV